MAQTTTGTEAELLKEYWRDIFLTELRASLILDQIALMAPHPAHMGTVVHWLSLADLTAAGTISESFDPTSYALSAGDLTAGLLQYGASVTLSDLVKKTAVGSFVDQLMERLARNAGLTLDTVIRDAILSAGGTVQYAGTAVARNSIATDGSFDFDIAELREAVNSLERQNVPPIGDSYVAIVHPDVKHDLIGDSKWVDLVRYTDNVERVYKNEIGRTYGTRFLESTQALLMDASGSASTDVYQTYVVGSEYLGISNLADVEIIVKDPAPKSDLNIVSTYGWKATRAHKELGALRMIRVESGSSIGD